MKKFWFIFAFMIFFCNFSHAQDENIIKLPEPYIDSKVSLEKTLWERRSQRTYKAFPLDIKEISQLLWAGQGITDYEHGKRTAPSANAKYPLDLYLVVFYADGLDKGIYEYLPEKHGLKKVFEDTKRDDIIKACNFQGAVSQSSVTIIIAGTYTRMSDKYNESDIRFTYAEVGHTSQNIFLQATALGLGTVVIGGFKQDELSKVLQFPVDTKALYVMPVGKK
jgi:SagB-type dehydrogenase family enzyme